MTKYEVCNWLSPGLVSYRLVFTTFGGSAHGKLTIESQDTETGEWQKVEEIGKANGCPKSGDGKISDNVHINRFTGKKIEEDNL